MLVMALTLGSVLSIPLQIPINYNEGWNAEFDTRAVTPGSGPLYPGPDGLVFDNYPPLGFLVVGGIGRFVVGDMIEAGRIVATLGLAATAILIGVAVARLGGSLRAAVAASVLMLLTTATFYRGYVAMDDPQWLAHAVMLGGLAVLLGRGVRDPPDGDRMAWGRVATAAALMVAGGFVKQNLIALPLAVTIWLFWRDRRLGLVWVLAGTVWLAAGFALLWTAYGPVAFADIFQHRRLLRVARLSQVPERLLPLLCAFVIMASRLRRHRCGEGAVLAWLFVAIACLIGSLQRIGEGVSYNAHFETAIAVCLGFGLALDQMPHDRRSGSAVAWLFAASPMIVAAYWHIPIAWHDVVDRMERQAAYRPVIERLARARGPVGCEMMSLCTWAGRPSAMDMFNLTQSLLAGGPSVPLRSAVSRRAFALVEIAPSSRLHEEAVRNFGGDPVAASLRGRYVPILRTHSGTVVLAPRATD